MTMKATYLVRRMDDLGRVVIPKEIRAKTGIDYGEPFDVMYDENGVYFKLRRNQMKGVGEKIEWQPEFEYILKFVEEIEYCDGGPYIEQLRALWTAFCLHQNVDVDTSKYDSAMSDIWNCLEKTENSLYNRFEYDEFYNEMCKYLV